MRKMGVTNENDAPVRTERSAPREKAERTPPRQFIREVQAELRKVAWPTKAEVKKYSIVVLTTVVLFTTMIALFDVGFGKLSIWLFN